MNHKQKKTLARILVTAALLIALPFVPATGWLRFGCYMVPYLVIGYDILRKAARGVRTARCSTRTSLMAVATVGAIALALYEGSGDYTEAVAVMLFYQVGEWFQSYAVGRSRRNISELMDIRPDYANVERDGKLTRVDPDEGGGGHRHRGPARGEGAHRRGGHPGQLRPEHRRPHRRVPAPDVGAGGRGRLRLRQHDRGC